MVGGKEENVSSILCVCCTFVFERWGNLVEYWLPFNEINAGYFSPYNGVEFIEGRNGFDLTDVSQPYIISLSQALKQ